MSTFSAFSRQHASRPLSSVGIGAGPIERDDGTIAFEVSPFDRMLSTAGAALGAYHGYKRHNSVGWAIGWGILGAMFPVITTAVAVAEGYGKRG